ncbi:MAG: carboxypeptidase-like regulatory domain-containing protein [bacterium]|nr:carboxypeptidase-like regulatory domain-containing protein [bacterium]
MTIDLVLTNNDTITKNIVYGIVDDNLNNSPIDNVTVSLYQIVDGEKVLVSTTTSIADGEFILDQIADGTYSLSFSKAGYQTVEVNNVILTGSTKFDTSTTLTSTIGTINSTVSGYIKNELGIAVANA